MVGDGTIYLMGGESLHPGVREYLSKSMGTDVQSIDELLEANQSPFFTKQISRAQLCLITPCVCGLMNMRRSEEEKIDLKYEMNLLPVNPVKKKRSDKTISKGGCFLAEHCWVF